MAVVSEFHTNAEYQDLILPLTTQECNELKESIKNNGQRIPVSVSNRTGQLVMIDGHHRDKACEELGIETKYIIEHFESEAEEIKFIEDCNKRRHLNKFQKCVIALKTKNKLAEIAKRNSALNSPFINKNSKHLEVERLGGKGVNEKLGKKAGSSHETMRNVERILKESPQHDIDKAMKGQWSIHKTIKHLENERKIQDLLNTKPVIDLPDNIRPIQGDFREKGKEIADNSIDLIFTDPFYANEYLYLYRDIGLLAARVLKSGGSLVLFGAYDLPKCMNLIAESGLKYVHTFAVIHEGQGGMDFPNYIRLKYKPMLWYVKGTKPNISEIIEDVIYSKLPDKSLHEMAQSPVEAEHVISKLTVENQIVLDPMMGAGTFGIAALKLKRQFIGIEIDKKKFEIADANISRHQGDV